MRSKSYLEVLSLFSCATENNEKFITIAEGYSQNFWRMYKKAKTITLTQAREFREGYDSFEWIEHLIKNPADNVYDFKSYYSKGNVWKHPDGYWRFYFNE